MNGFRPLSAGSFSVRSLCSVMMCKLLLLSSTAGFVLLAGKQEAIAAGSTTGNPGVDEQSGKERVLGYTPCPPIRPDCDRNRAIDVGDSLPDDFTVSKQTPYRTGRNEVLITSPSTGTEQRFEINLPDTGSFQLYKASFNKVKVSNPEKVLGAGASLSPQQVAAKLRRFEINFERNAPKTVVLADGTRGEFSASGVVIRSKNGRVIETVKTSAMPKMQPQLMAALPVGSDAVVAHAGSSGRSCQSSIRSKLYDMSQKVQRKGADILKQNATSEEAKLIAWVTTFSQKALEDSLIVNNRNQTLQQVACEKPVQCNQPQNYEGGWETRTDLFKLPGGNNKLSLRYEFYQIPDSIELWREGKLIRKIGPKSGAATVSIEDTALQGTGYVGVKVIGNPTNQKTLWNYTISCSGGGSTQIVVKIEKWENEIPGTINWPDSLFGCKTAQTRTKVITDNGWAVNLDAFLTLKIENKGVLPVENPQLLIVLSDDAGSILLEEVQMKPITPGTELQTTVKLKFPKPNDFSLFIGKAKISAKVSDNLLSVGNDNGRASDDIEVLLADPRPVRRYDKFFSQKDGAELYLENQGFNVKFGDFAGWTKELSGSKIRSRRDGKLKPPDHFRQDAFIVPIGKYSPGFHKRCNKSGYAVTIQGEPSFGEPNPFSIKSWVPYFTYVKWWHSQF